MKVKRLTDLIISFVMIILLAPIFIVVAIIIKISSPGPILFVQKRVGKKAKEFSLYKFRSMKVDKEAQKNFDTSKDEQRVTMVGKFLRRTKIDELPQLFNILKGDMSFIGPRPTIMQQVQNYNKRQMKRLDVRPGLTGLAQVNGNIYLTWDERIDYDLHYIENYSLLMDLKIFLKTVVVVILGEKVFLKRKKGT